MKKNLSILIISVLVIIILLQAYFLYKKESTKQEATNNITQSTKNSVETIIQTEKTQIPPIVIEEKNENNISSLDEPKNLDTKQLEQDIKKIFRDILSSKEVQDGLDEMKSQLKEAQKQMNDLLNEFDKVIQDDLFFDSIFQQLQKSKPMKFQERDDYYVLKILIPNINSSNINIQREKDLLVVTFEKDGQQNQNRVLIAIPEDALIEKMQTNYQNKILEIVVPKIVSQTEI